MFRVLLAHLQEGAQTAFGILRACNNIWLRHDCSFTNDEQVMLETCRGI
jgi:hypothetical protein